MNQHNQPKKVTSWASRLILWVCALTISWFLTYAIVTVGQLIWAANSEFASTLMFPSLALIFGGGLLGAWMAALGRTHPLVKFLQQTSGRNLAFWLIGVGSTIVGAWMGELLATTGALVVGEVSLAMGGTVLLYRRALSYTYLNF